MAKSVFATTLVFGILSITVFGFAAVHGANMNHWLGCISTTISRTSCPVASGNPFVPVNYHFNALKTVSTVAFGGGFPELAGLLLVFAVAAVLLGAGFRPAVEKFSQYIRRVFEPPRFSHQQEFSDWLSRFINSPALRPARA